MRIDSIYLREVGPFDDVRIDLPEGTNPDLADVDLLTGPNGCGKSTVLYAIAAAVSGGDPFLGKDLVQGRLRSSSALTAVRVGDTVRAVAWGNVNGRPRKELPNPFPRGIRSLPEIGFWGHYRSNEPSALETYSGNAVSFHRKAPEARDRFEWAAFAYSGQRSIDDVEILAPQEPKTSPLLNSLDFAQSADSNTFFHWVANQEFRRLKAEAAAHQDRAKSIARSVRDIEHVVSQIIDDEFRFLMTDEDNNVRVQRNGMPVRLGVLPTGLQSIVSWVADLLMRLDRIPWVDDVPPMQRSFLLLLDEIDIHLHPAWQRKVIPIVQRLFPNAQIIASTHSPFVVASADDAHIVTFAMKDGISSLESIETSQIGRSYRAILQDIFGIASEFDVDTEALFREFYAAKTDLLQGKVTDRAHVDRLVRQLAQRGEEVEDIVGFELHQLERHLAKRAAG